MNEIKPFFAWRYNTKKVDLSRVVAPPYDVVSTKEQEFYLQQSPYNVFHLELGRNLPSDSPNNNRYTRARKLWNLWRKKKIIIKEEKPALYLYRLRFAWKNSTLVRRGIIALVRLSPWEKKFIRPHEKTFDQVTQDRLFLLRETQAQFSQVFCLYNDPSLTSLESLESKAESLFKIEDKEGFVHEISRVTDAHICQNIANFFKNKILYIADGHHRYTTSLQYMQEMEQKFGSKPLRCYHYIMMYLCAFEDPTLLVLPTHRLVKIDIPLSELSKRLKIYGELTSLSLALDKDSLGDFLETLDKYSFVFLHGGGLFCFSPYKEIKEKFLREIPQELHQVPVAFFSKVFKKVLGATEAEFKNKDRIFYTPWLEEIFSMLRDFGAAFLLPPTPISTLKQASDNGLVMPHKSTYFFPKILTGTLFFNVLPQEGPPCGYYEESTIS